MIEAQDNRLFVIGFDVSARSTGYCVLDGGGFVVEKGTFGYALPKKDDGAFIDRTLFVADKVLGIMKKHIVGNRLPPVAMEGYSYGEKFGREVLAELQGVVRSQVRLVFKSVMPRIAPTRARAEIGIEIEQKKVRKKVDGEWVVETRKKVKPVKDQVRDQLQARGVLFHADDPSDIVDAYVVARCVWLRHTGGVAHV